jgi:hypothetical protein
VTLLVGFLFAAAVVFVVVALVEVALWIRK